MSQLEALIFDVDGTLADTEGDGHLVAFNMAFEEAGLDWHWSGELYGELLAVTGGKERIRFYLNDFYPSERGEVFSRPSIEDESFNDFVAQLHAAKTRFFKQLMVDGAVPLRSGVARLFQEARAANLRLAIATTTTPSNVTALLTNTLGEESIEWFEVIAAGDIVPAKKPAADIYLYALEQMNLKPEQCLAFEDSHNGILSSKGADLKTIITINDYTKDHDFKGADLVLSDFGEPDQAMTVISGDCEDAYFSLSTARKIHQA
ncbi:MAG: HAD family hydrolase [gamma proteobacterium symbiont of Taylorina sp.]|nr:HAD family hydrolase [gamma proteobacterium symbiont of Taylorina sp.]